MQKKLGVWYNDEFRFNDRSTHEGHLRQSGILTWFCNETVIMVSHGVWYKLACVIRSKIL